MELKKLEIINGIYQCDVGITVEEWKKILQGERFEGYLDTLKMFYAEPSHSATCKFLGEKHGIDSSSISGKITHFAKGVQKKLNRFKVENEAGKEKFWIIPALGKKLGKHFEWTLRPELVQAIEELNIREKHFLQKVYDEAIANGDGVFSGWFPYYKKYIQRLVKDTDNGVSSLRQGNFEWEEYYKIRDNWSEIQPKIQHITEKNKIDKAEYQEIIELISKHIPGNRPVGTNRIIAAFLPNVVTTIVNYKYLKEVILALQKRIKDYPVIQYNWLSDNTNFINYCNENVSFIDPWHSSLFAWYLKDYFKKEREYLQQKQASMQKYIDLLERNKNLILTGAPGTGKTFLAKRIAKQMNAEMEFVQFHPSYDYTDFVEGLRPFKKEGSEFGFQLKDGIFKAFCKKAIEKKSADNFDELYAEFTDGLSENNELFETPTHKKKFRVEINGNKSCVAIPETEVGTRMSITKEMIKNYIQSGEIRDWKPYTIPIAERFQSRYEIKTEAIIQEKKPFVIIIDEINRAEISKVFGELFFSIDPGYRGTNGRVKTQYSNLQEDGDLFKDGFYVPENVYIIGTMNDIDRSVESFDFAMRRRFAWQAIYPLDRISMWDGSIDDFKEEAKERMESLNSAIENIRGLGSAFHIGPAYFLKLKNFSTTLGHSFTRRNHRIFARFTRQKKASFRLENSLR